MALIDPTMIQRFLMYSSDFIQESAINKLGFTADLVPRDNMVYLMPQQSTERLEIPPEKYINYIRNEKKLLSDTPILSEESAVELFADRTFNEGETSIEFDYILSHEIYLPEEQEPVDGGPAKVKLYKFNIDKINKEADGKFFIKKVSIVNRSKDIFTTKSNYHITLSINFTYFDDLFEENVEMVNVEDQTDIKKFAIIKILYKFFDLQKPDVADSEEARLLRDQVLKDGVYLKQTLKFHDTTRISSTVSDYGTAEYNKIYHLMFYKHSFNAFKSNDPIVQILENELVIEYYAYESHLDKKHAAANTPSTDGNIFDIVKDSDWRYGKGGTDSVTDTLNGLAQHQQYLRCFAAFRKTEKPEYISNMYKKVGAITKEEARLTGMPEDARNKFNRILQFGEPDPVTSVAPIDVNATLDNISAEEQHRKNLIKDTKEKILIIKHTVDRQLVEAILDQCTVYGMMVNPDLLDIWEKEDLWKKWLLWGAAGVAAAAAIYFTGGTVLLGVGAVESIGFGITTAAVAGTYIGFSAMTAYQLYQAADSYKPDLIKPKDNQASEFREGIGMLYRSRSSLNVYRESGRPKFTGLAKREGLEEVDEKTRKKYKEALDNIYGTNIPKYGSTDEISLRFIFFGDIIKLYMAATQNCCVIVGGKVISTSTNSGYGSFVNYAYMPVSYNLFVKFLVDKIIEKDRSGVYTAELFLKDAFDELIKKTGIVSGNVINGANDFIPSSARMISGIHDGGNENYTKMLDTKIVNLSDDPAVDKKDFKKFIGEYSKSKNLTIKDAAGSNLKKVFVLSSDEVINYYDFYNSYKTENTITQNIFNTKDFQKWINKKFFIPCILLKNTAMDESILKNKHVSFTRMDNANLEVGTFLNSGAVFRRPYSFSAILKSYLSFFSSLGTLVFIAPPNIKDSKNINPLGFGGLYVLTGAQLDYNFQALEKNNITLPNETAEYRIEARMLSFGDAVKNNPIKPLDKLLSTCRDLK